MTHGLMFHYFHNEEIAQSQGSITSDQFEKIIDNYSANHNILPASEYLNKAINKKLSSSDVCITFDDGLYCQYVIADKILRKKGLTAFYFVYTSPMDGVLEKMEVYRKFRNEYEDINDFYFDFFEQLIEYGDKIGIDYKKIIESKEARDYFVNYNYYSVNDRVFRFLRNEILKEKYDLIMKCLMQKKQFIPEKECKNIWISSNQLFEMNKYGNIIGLHSHSHFTNLNGMTKEKKEWEYKINKKKIEENIKNKVTTASYPCDTYDIESDNILKKLGITLAFIAHYEESDVLNLRRIPRIDASEILRNL